MVNSVPLPLVLTLRDEKWRESASGDQLHMTVGGWLLDGRTLGQSTPTVPFDSEVRAIAKI